MCLCDCVFIYSDCSKLRRVIIWQLKQYMAEEKKAAQGRQYQMDDEVLFGGWRDWLYLTTVCSSHSVGWLVSQSDNFFGEEENNNNFSFLNAPRLLHKVSPVSYQTTEVKWTSSERL